MILRYIPRWPAWLLFLLTAMLLAAATTACGGDDSTTNRPSPAVGVPAGGPPPPAVLEILGQVAALRGLPNPPKLKVATVRRDEVPALLDATVSDADRTWFAQTTTLYRLLGFLKPDESYLDVFRSFAGTAVVGLYYPANQTLYVVPESGRPIESLNASEKQTLAHELTHALQDAAFDLSTLASGVQQDIDRQLVFLALVEGDAVTHGQLWTRRSGLVPFRAGGGALLFADARSSLTSTPAAIAVHALRVRSPCE